MAPVLESISTNDVNRELYIRNAELAVRNKTLLLLHVMSGVTARALETKEMVHEIVLSIKKSVAEIAEKKPEPNLSEEIKKSYAAAGSYDLYEDEEILVKNESVYITLKRAQIYSAVNPQVDNFLEQITGAINDCVGYQNLNCGITLIGGGALMPGLIEKIGESVKMPVKLGKLNVFSQKKFSNLAEIISVVGLAYNAYLKTLKYGVDAKGHSNWAKILSNKIKELYLEYF